MTFVPHTAEEKQELLKSIGVGSFEELISFVPESDRFVGELHLPAPQSELEVRRQLHALAGENQSTEQLVSFLGAGAYDHYVPAVIDHIISRSEFYTAYTPYQAEVSQGTLQAIYEFQSQICELFGMEVCNASMYDGASALAEACHAARDITRRNRVVILESVHPYYVQVVKTYTHGLRIPLITVPSCAGCQEQVNLAAVAAAVDEQTAAVLVQHPNLSGYLEPVRQIAQIAHSKGALLIVSVDPISLGILEPPGAYDADIAVAEGQPLGIPLSFGGPYLGIYTTRRRYIRQLPGRLVARTTDQKGRIGYCLALQTREQHIRREKATSNICTNQALCALMANVYLAVMGREGIREVARQCLLKTRYLAEKISRIDGFALVGDGVFFKEFAIRTPVPPGQIIAEALTEGILAGVDLGMLDSRRSGELLVAVTEKRTRSELDRFAGFLKRYGR